MKKIILTAAIVFGMVSANAQEVKFGVKTGLNIASVNNSGLDDEEKKGLKPLYSFHAGGFAEINLSEQLAIQPELIYSVQGQKFEQDVPVMPDLDTTNPFTGSVPSLKTEKRESTIKLNYINIPVMVKYYVMDALALEVGPQIGFLISTKLGYKVDGKDQFDGLSGEDLKEAEKSKKEYETEFKKDMNSVDFGMNFGASYNVTDNLSLGARYNLGLADLKLDESETNKNSVIQVSLGYSF